MQMSISALMQAIRRCLQQHTQLSLLKKRAMYICTTTYYSTSIYVVDLVLKLAQPTYTATEPPEMATFSPQRCWRPLRQDGISVVTQLVQYRVTQGLRVPGLLRL